MSYEAYKVIHLAAILVFLPSAAVLLMARLGSRRWKMITGFSSLLVLVGGMGALARTGAGFPPWAQAKIVIWLVVTGLGHVVAKRFPRQAGKALAVTIALAVVAAFLAVYKTF